MRRLLLVLALVGCSSKPTTPVSAPAPAVVRGVPDSLRTAVGTFRLVSRNVIEGFATDTLFRYADSTGFGVSVFRFPIRDDVKKGSTDPVKWLEAEAAKFIAIQPILRERRAIDSSVVRLTKLVPIYPNGPPAVEYITAIEQWGRRGNTIEVEHLWIVGDRFLKVRGSERNRESGMSPTTQFALRLVRAMTR